MTDGAAGRSAGQAGGPPGSAAQAAEPVGGGIGQRRDGPAGRQVGGLVGKATNPQIDRQSDGPADRQGDGSVGGESVRQIDRQIDRQGNGPADSRGDGRNDGTMTGRPGKWTGRLSGRSLRWRLGLAGAAAILVALALATLGLTLLFERHVERVAVADLTARALSVAAMVEPGPEGAGFGAPPADPLYDQPFSGHYWQVELGGALRHSRSLWDSAFPPAPVPAPPGTRRSLSLSGPQGEPLLAVEQWLEVGAGEGAVPLRILVATRRDALDLARQGFLSDILPWLGLLGLLLVAASWAQITLGLRPLADVSDRVAALRAGRRPRIGTDLPREVRPLAGEIDQLLDARDAELARARHRAADLAHGFKTPLQALLGDAAQLEARGEPRLAASIETIVAAMRRLVDRELARARIQSDRVGALAEPAVVVARVVAVLRRMPKGAQVDWRIAAPPGLRARIDTDDLTEALGALCENALRHAAGRVRVAVRAEDGWIAIRIADDGPGVAEDDLQRLSQRGLRLDTAGDGQGIGLAIAADIAQAAGGELTFANANPGLEACLRLRGA